MIVGYARVSTDGQTLDSQLAALRQAGAERVYSEKVSGVVSDRKALRRTMEALGHGDVLLVTRLDRLARSTRDLLNVLVRCRSLVQDFGLSQMLGLTLPPPMVG